MPRILTCDRCYEEWWMEEDEEEPCPYCAEDRLEAARDAYWDMKIEERLNGDEARAQVERLDEE